MSDENKINSTEEKIETILHDQYAKTQGDIQIRELVALQTPRQVANAAPNPRGEYKKEATQKMETKVELLNRIKAYITQLGDIARDKHLADNFVDSKLKPAKQNHITRLSLHESALYPQFQQGALTLTDFNDLLCGLDTLAATYPDNLHLALGTLPVNIKGVVHNVGIYIECGILNRHIHIFSKATYSHFDPQYHGTHGQSFHANMPNEQELMTLGNFFQNLAPRFLAENPDFTYFNDGFKTCIQAAKACGNTHNKVHAQFETIYNKATVDPNYRYTKSFLEDLTQLREMVIDAQDAAEKIQETLVAQIAPAAPGLGNKEMGILPYGGNFVCKTAGGRTMRVGIEICLDHKSKLIQSAIQQETIAAPKSDQWQPTKMTQMLMSNSAFLLKKSVNGETVTLVDPIHSYDNATGTMSKRLKAEKRIAIANAQFGETESVIDIYPLQRVGKHATSTQQQIEMNNEKIIKNRVKTLSENNKISEKDIIFKTCEKVKAQVHEAETTFNGSPTGSYFMKHDKHNIQANSHTNTTLNFFNASALSALTDDQHVEPKVARKPYTSGADPASLLTEGNMMLGLCLLTSVWSSLPSFPWNTQHQLTIEDAKFLDAKTMEFVALVKEIRKKKETKVYRAGINAEAFDHCHELYASVKKIIVNVAGTRTMSATQKKELTEKLSELSQLVPTLSNSILKKEARKHLRKIGM